MRPASKTPIKTSIAILVAGGVAGALATLVWQLLIVPVDVSPLQSAGSTTTPWTITASNDAKPTTSDTIGDYPQTSRRPLFFADRRPPQPKKKPAVKVTRKPKPAAKPKPVIVKKLPDGIKLVGIVKGANDRRRALVRLSNSDTGKWIEEGQVLDGWRIVKIDHLSITLETSRQREKLSLFAKSN